MLTDDFPPPPPPPATDFHCGARAFLFLPLRRRARDARARADDEPARARARHAAAMIILHAIFFLMRARAPLMRARHYDSERWWRFHYACAPCRHHAAIFITTPAVFIIIYYATRRHWFHAELLLRAAARMPFWYRQLPPCARARLPCALMRLPCACVCACRAKMLMRARAVCVMRWRLDIIYVVACVRACVKMRAQRAMPRVCVCVCACAVKRVFRATPLPLSSYAMPFRRWLEAIDFLPAITAGYCFFTAIIYRHCGVIIFDYAG